MAYVSRDNEGNITGVARHANAVQSEFLAGDSQEYQNYLAQQNDPRQSMQCSPWQFRKALNQLELRGDVEAMMADSNTPQDIKDGWEYAQQIERLHPDVIAMGQALDKTDEELDQIFALAMTL